MSFRVTVLVIWFDFAQMCLRNKISLLFLFLLKKKYKTIFEKVY